MVVPPGSGTVVPGTNGGSSNATPPGSGTLLPVTHGGTGNTMPPPGTVALPSSNTGGHGGTSPSGTEPAMPGMGGMTSTGGTTAVGGAGGFAAPEPVPDEVPLPTLLGDVAFSEPSRTFEGQLEVAMTANAEIRYTTDGTLPTASSALYDGTPLILTETTQLRAATVVDGVASLALSTAIYIARSLDVTSDIPIVIVDGYAKGKPNTEAREFEDAAFMMFEPSNGVAAISATPNLASRAGYHVRGQSSSSFEKTPYRIELWDNLNQDADYPMMGMPAEADWALVGPYVDRTLVRNALVYSLGRDMGMRAPRFAFAEVYLNYEARPLDETDYMGVYVVTETIKNAKNRLDLKRLDETNIALPEISGGYIFKFEWRAAEEPILPCNDPAGGQSGGSCWSDLEVYDPLPLVEDQATWLQQYIQEFHDTLHTEPIGAYGDYIDVASFVDHFIVNEVTRNGDAYVRSCYFHKDRDTKIFAGPLWDYNLATGTGGIVNNLEIEGWQWEAVEQQRGGTSDWFYRLASDPDFMALVTGRWQELRSGLFSNAQLEARIAELTLPIRAAAERDHLRWPVDEIDSSFQMPDGATWAEQISAMQTWLWERLEWLDTQWL
jgi:hypothetical protein